MNMPLLGNERVLNNILSMIKNDRLPHAMLIEGESGLGKSTLALFLAKACLCIEKEPPCGVCKSCHLADVGTHPDILIVKPDGAQIKVEQIREFRKDVYLKPLFYTGRVFIIECADTMNENAQNAMLKVLEEPPTETHFILVSQNSSLLLPTIISRCVRFTLSPVAVNSESISVVQKNTESSYSEAEISLISTDGNIGKAIKLLKNDEVVLWKVVNDIMLAAAENNRFQILMLLQQFSKERNTALKLIGEIKNALSKEMQKKSVKEYSSFTNSKLTFCYDEMTDIENSMIFNPSLSLVFCKIAYVLTK